MRFPFINSLYGRIFAIFWLTMLLVLLAVLSLPHFDPRQAHSIPSHRMQELMTAKDFLEARYEKYHNLKQIIGKIEKSNQKRRRDKHKGSMLFFVTDQDNNILSSQHYSNKHIKAIQNFITSVDLGETTKQRLYGQSMVSGPFPLELANVQLKLYISNKWDRPPPVLIRLFDQPFQLLLAVMLVSTPLLLWLAWAVSQPARKLANAAKQVAKGNFVVNTDLEKGTSEFRQAGTSFNQMVLAVNQMISGQQRLLSDISHELRSPLTRLRMANALAIRKQGESNELSRIDTEAQRLEQMISELLALSRMQVDNHLERERQPASSLWEAIIADAQFEAQQINKHVHATAIPNAHIFGNPKLLMSAIENIIRNAILYSHQRIEVQFVHIKHSLKITVEDDGDGVPESELEAIFRPFYRVSTARDRHSGGTGLGLTIAESAIRQHNGTLVASKSELGGLKLVITLPLANESTA